MSRGIANDKNSGLTQEALRDVLSYNRRTGIFRWKKNTGKKRMVGLIAGNETKGYWEISICGRSYKAHRLAWLYVHGVWPEHDLDHVNGNKLGNSIENLREASRPQNNANSGLSRRNKSGRKGVYRHSQTGRWSATIMNGRSLHLGCFDSFEEACEARMLAENTAWGEFVRS